MTGFPYWSLGKTAFAFVKFQLFDKFFIVILLAIYKTLFICPSRISIAALRISIAALILGVSLAGIRHYDLLSVNADQVKPQPLPVKGKDRK